MNCKKVKFLGFALLLGGIAICGTGLWLWLSPPKYQASARIMISSEITTLIPPDFSKLKNYFDSDTYAASLIPGELKIIESNEVLRKAVENLKLCAEWGVSTNKALRMLKHRVSLSLVPVYLRIEISATDTNPQRAVKIINGVIDAYCQYRGAQWRETQQASIEKIKRSFPELEQKIKIAQERFDKLTKELNLPEPIPSWVEFKTNNPSYFQAGEDLWEAKARYDTAKWFVEPRFANIEQAAKPPSSPIGLPDWLGMVLCESSLVVCLLGYLIISFSRRLSTECITSP